MNSCTLRFLEEILRCLRQDQVERNCFDRDAVLGAKLLGDLRESGPAARYEDQIESVASEQLGQFIADASGSSGDESGLLCGHIGEAPRADVSASRRRTV